MGGTRAEDSETNRYQQHTNHEQHGQTLTDQDREIALQCGGSLVLRQGRSPGCVLTDWKARRVIVLRRDRAQGALDRPNMGLDQCPVELWILLDALIDLVAQTFPFCRLPGVEALSPSPVPSP